MVSVTDTKPELKINKERKLGEIHGFQLVFGLDEHNGLRRG